MRYNDYISKKEALKRFKKYDETIIKNNKLYIEKGLIDLKEYFDYMYDNVDSNIKLDDEQRIAILKDEDYNIILAGAGSGKTTTLAAKVKFLVDIKKINPKDIVVISFTNKAVLELKQRINKDFKINCLICTFHKFGLILLNSKPNIISDSYLIIKNILKNYLYNDKKLLKQLILLFKEYFNVPIYAFLFSSINKFIDIKDKILSFFNLNKKDNYIDDFVYLCTNFIQQFKIKGYQEKDFFNIKTNNKREKIFIDLIIKVYQKYQEFLFKNNSLDFEDIINESYLKLNDLKLNYKYIIVDEYQDISYQRFKLIKKVSDISKAKIIAVGDDWQTIYSFSGSEINLFTDFEKIVGYTSLSKITNTYRNSQELIDVAGKFIMENPNQIKKQLKSVKHIENPIVIVYYSNKVKSLNECLENIKPNSKVLLLGRYNFDINYYLGKYFKKENEKIISIKYPNLDITFLSVHSAKGLGFDNVIVLNCNDDVYGFPSKVKTDSIFNLINENDQLQEERRLFYVALTRTKNKVYILADKNKPSTFVEEIKTFKNVTFM